MAELTVKIRLKKTIWYFLRFIGIRVKGKTLAKIYVNNRLADVVVSGKETK